jgi:hypothetical protein
MHFCATFTAGIGALTLCKDAEIDKGLALVGGMRKPAFALGKMVACGAVFAGFRWIATSTAGTKGCSWHGTHKRHYAKQRRNCNLQNKKQYQSILVRFSICPIFSIFAKYYRINLEK